MIGTHIIGTNPQNTHNTRKDQKDDYGRHPCACGNPTTRHDKAFFRHIIKGFARQRLMRKGLNRLHSPKVFRGIARTVCDPILVFLAQLSQATPQGQDGNNDGGHDQQNQPCQLCRGQQHHPQSTDKDQQVAQRNRNRWSNHRKDQCGVRCNAAKDLAREDRFIKTWPHSDDTAKDGLANIGHNPFAQSRDQRIPHRCTQRQ